MLVYVFVNLGHDGRAAGAGEVDVVYAVRPTNTAA